MGSFKYLVCCHANFSSDNPPSHPPSHQCRLDIISGPQPQTYALTVLLKAPLTLNALTFPITIACSPFPTFAV